VRRAVYGPSQRTNGRDSPAHDPFSSSVRPANAPAGPLDASDHDLLAVELGEREAVEGLAQGQAFVGELADGDGFAERERR
jgi:hypothetical protein